MNVTTIGIDLAKNSFSLAGCDRQRKILFGKTSSRHKLLPFIAGCSPFCIGFAARSGAH